MTAVKSRNSKAKKIYNVVSTVAITVVLLFLIVVVIATVMQRKQGSDVKLFGHYTYTVLSNSMEPTINKGDTIWCKEIEDGDIKEGAVVTFVAPSGALKGYNITHRIVEITYGENDEMQIHTKGDNPDVGVDSWTLSKDEIKAVYVKTLPLLSGIMSFMSKQPFLSYVLFIALPIMLVGVLFIVGYVRDRVKAETVQASSNAGADKKADGSEKSVSLDELSDEEKQKILNEFLLEQKNKTEGNGTDGNADNTDYKDGADSGSGSANAESGVNADDIDHTADGGVADCGNADQSDKEKD